MIDKGATTEMVAALNSPTPPEKVQWRGDRTTKDKSRMNVLGYIDARFVMETLDAKVLPENWQDRYEDIPGGTRCGIGILINGEWVWKWDAAPHSDIESVKGGHSDALKRAAVKWGIGRDLYDLPDLWVATEPAYPGSDKVKPAILPTWTGTQWTTDRGNGRQAPQNAPQRPVAVPLAASHPALMPEPPEFPDDFGPPPEEFPTIGLGRAPQPGDECPEHPGSKWLGSVGDLFHKKPEGGYCRPVGQKPKAKVAR